MEKLLTIKEVTYIVGFKQSTIYKFIKTKAFPKPIKIGRASRWKQSDIQNWIINLQFKKCSKRCIKNNNCKYCRFYIGGEK